VANLRQLWQSSLPFRRVTAASVFCVTALLVYLGSHIPRSVSLPADELNARAMARVGEEQIVIRNPAIAEGDLALSYVGNKNEIADLWLENATLDDRSQRLLFPGNSTPAPARISYTTGASPDKPQADDTCHTTIEIRRAKGSAPVTALKLYQSDATAGAQRFRQVVVDAGATTMELEIHTDAPTLEATDLPGCHKLLQVGANQPIDLPPIPIRLVVPSGKIDLHFNPANASQPIWTGNGQTFEAVSLGDSVLRGEDLQVVSTVRPKAKLEVRASPAANRVTLSHLKIGSEMLQLDIGRDTEKAMAYADGASLYNYNLVATIQQNPILSFAFAAVLVPALWKWVRKNCFPNSSE